MTKITDGFSIRDGRDREKGELLSGRDEGRTMRGGGRRRREQWHLRRGWRTIWAESFKENVETGDDYDRNGRLRNDNCRVKTGEITKFKFRSAARISSRTVVVAHSSFRLTARIRRIHVNRITCQSRASAVVTRTPRREPPRTGSNVCASGTTERYRIIFPSAG